MKDNDLVVTQCGHIYCWPCLYLWLHARHGDGTYPVCKANVGQENFIPIFIRGSTTDPRNKPNVERIPSRPQVHRPEPSLNNSLNAQLGIGGPFLQQFYATSFPAGIGFSLHFLLYNFRGFLQQMNPL